MPDRRLGGGRVHRAPASVMAPKSAGPAPGETCTWVRARLIASAGHPTYTIATAKPGVLFGVEESDRPRGLDQPANLWRLPSADQRAMATQVHGDFLVCPSTKRLVGELGRVWIKKAVKLRVVRGR